MLSFIVSFPFTYVDAGKNNTQQVLFTLETVPFHYLHMRKLCLSTKFPHHEIRWNYDILRSVHFPGNRIVHSNY